MPLSPDDQPLFVRSTRLETMRAAPTRIDWKPLAGDADAARRDELAALIDFSLLEEIFENFLAVTGLPIAVIDMDGKVLASSRWQRLCIDFHRAHPQTRTGCLHSDMVLSQEMRSGKDYAIYQCANGLIDCATPIVLDGIHVANLFTGQFLQDAPDPEFFHRQQNANGFEQDAYFAALAEIPIVSESKIPAILRLLKGLAQQIARRSVAEKRALSTLAEVERQVEERTSELSERGEQFRALFEGSPVGQLICDPYSFRILECNQAAADIYGYSREELQQFRVIDLDAMQDQPALMAIDANLKGIGRVTFTTRIRRKDGQLRDAEVTVVMLRSTHGDKDYVTLVDVTEQKRTEEARNKIERALRLLTDCHDALLHADDERQLLDEVCRLTVDTGGYLMSWVGLAQNDAGRTVRPVAQSGYEEGYLESIRVTWDESETGHGPTGTAIRTGNTQINHNCLTNPRMAPWRDAAIRRGYQSSIALPLAGDAGILGALTIYAREADAFSVEEVQLLEKLAESLTFGIDRLRDRIRLARANAELQGFTYAASHDMRGPLGRISAFSTLLERQYRDRLDGDGLHFLEFIRQNATRLNVLVEDLLAHSQLEQQTRSLQALDLRAAVLAALDDQRDDIQQHGAEVHIAVPAMLASANPHGLAQALRNLLANALKYSSQAKPPVIEIGGERSGDRCRIWIRDNGIGFDMAYHERIFEIFRRLHTYKEYPGNGVGLALVKKAIEGMGGKVWAESAPGQGATFFLEIPSAS